MWDLHPVIGPNCCSTPHSNANSVLPMADVHHGHLYLRRNQLPHMQWLLFKDDSHLTSSIWSDTVLSKLSHCSKRCSQSIEFLKYSTPTMALSMWVQNLLSSAPLGVSHMRPQACTTCNQMDLPRHVSDVWSMHSDMLSTAVPTHSLPFWCSKLHPLMPSSHHLLSSCTDARFGPPFLPEFATQTQQPTKFVNMLMLTLMPPSHRQTNDANPLHPCMPASLLWCMTPSTRSGSLPLWKVSCQKTATKCAPTMAWSTAAWNYTFVNAVSNPLTLPPMSQQPHYRLLPDPAFLQQCLHPPSLHNCHSIQLLHLQWLQLQNHRHQLSLKSPLCLCLCLQHPI